jgi:CDP-diacylglycerol--inositol 3-phosphatidyltransferase
VSTFASLAVADVSPMLCLVAYFVSFACDELDGRFARMLNQASKFGIVLDMATDRVSTAGLLALLCKYSPAYHPLWIALIMLDVGSHWFHMYASLSAGEASHKVRACAVWRFVRTCAGAFVAHMVLWS